MKWRKWFIDSNFKEMISAKFLWGNVLLGEKQTSRWKKNQFENFWERPLSEISEYAFNYLFCVLYEHFCLKSQNWEFKRDRYPHFKIFWNGREWTNKHTNIFFRPYKHNKSQYMYVCQFTSPSLLHVWEEFNVFMSSLTAVVISARQTWAQQSAWRDMLYTIIDLLLPSS